MREIIYKQLQKTNKHTTTDTFRISSSLVMNAPLGSMCRVKAVISLLNSGLSWTSFGVSATGSRSLTADKKLNISFIHKHVQCTNCSNHSVNSWLLTYFTSQSHTCQISYQWFQASRSSLLHHIWTWINRL